MRCRGCTLGAHLRTPEWHSKSIPLPLRQGCPHNPLDLRPFSFTVQPSVNSSSKPLYPVPSNSLVSCLSSRHRSGTYFHPSHLRPSSGLSGLVNPASKLAHLSLASGLSDWRSSYLSKVRYTWTAKPFADQTIDFSTAWLLSSSGSCVQLSLINH